VTANLIQGIARSKEKKAVSRKQESASNKLIKKGGQEKDVHFFRRWINSCEYGTEPFSKRRLDQ
jgi:hypothetical protein